MPPYPSGSPAQSFQSQIGGTTGTLTTEITALTTAAAQMDTFLSSSHNHGWDLSAPITTQALKDTKDAYVAAKAALVAVQASINYLNALMAESSALIP